MEKRTTDVVGTASSAGPAQADAADWAAGCGSEAECGEVDNWTSPAVCAVFPKHCS